MKKFMLFSLILCVITVWSCHKNSSSNNSPNSGYYLSSATSVTAGIRVVDSFDYDSAHRLLQLLQTKFDTSSGTAVSTVAAAQFMLPATGLPTGYIYSIKSGTLNSTEQHTLTFDNQNRVIKDTCATSGYVAYYSYPSGNIAATVYFDGSPSNKQIDTLFLSNGNVATANTWMPNNAGTADSLQGSLKFGYSGLANPAYHSSITGSLGPLLYQLTVNGLGGGLDPVSQKASSSLTPTIAGLPFAITINFNQTTDSKGRLSTFSGSVPGYGGETVYFNYY